MFTFFCCSPILPIFPYTSKGYPLLITRGATDHRTHGSDRVTVFLQALCRAEDEEDIVAASQAKAEQVAELAEFNENIPLDDGGDQEEVEELSKAEQEIAALVEQVRASVGLNASE